MYLCLPLLPAVIFLNDPLHSLVRWSICPIRIVKAIVPGVKLLSAAAKHADNNTVSQNRAVGIELLWDDERDRDGSVSDGDAAVRVGVRGHESLVWVGSNCWS